MTYRGASPSHFTNLFIDHAVINDCRKSEKKGFGAAFSGIPSIRNFIKIRSAFQEL
jgi:hypothetical protein